MAGNQMTLYSFEKVAAFINGGQITGFWEGDDAVSVEPGVDITSTMVGAGGDPLVSVSTNRTALIKIKLQHTGEGHALMSAIYAQYQAGAPFPFSVGVTDTGTGDGGSAPEAVIQGGATIGLGSEASMREWTILAGCFTTSPTSYVGA